MKQLCPNCGQEYDFSESQKGKNFSCLECDAEFVIGKISVPPEPVSPPDFRETPILKPLERKNVDVPSREPEKKTGESHRSGIPAGARKKKIWIALTVSVVILLILGSVVFFLRSAEENPPPANPGPSIAEQKMREWDEAKKLIRDGDPAGLSKRLSRIDVNHADSRGETLLMFASRQNQQEILQILISAGAEINREDSSGATAMHHAAKHGRIANLKFLLSKGGSVSAGSSNTDSLLALAAEQGNLEMIRLLLDHYDPPAEYGSREISILRAARKGYLDCVKELLRKYDVNLQDERGNTILMAAVSSGNLEMFQFILKKIVSPDLTNQQGESACSLALRQDRREMLALFDWKTVNLSQSSSDGTTLPMLCAQKANLELLPRLLTPENLNRRDKAGRNVLYYAVQQKSPEMQKFLIGRKCEINAPLLEQSALYPALKNQDPASVKLLLESGADVRLCDAAGNTAVMLAAQSGNPEIVQLLLDRNVSVLLKNRDGKTASELAFAAGHNTIGKTLGAMEKKFYMEQLNAKVEAILKDKKRPYAEKENLLKALEPSVRKDSDRKKILDRAKQTILAEEAKRTEILMKACMASALKDKYFESAIRTMERALRNYPLAANRKEAEKMLQDLREAMRKYELRTEALNKKKKAVESMSESQIRREIEQFVNQWLNDMRMDYKTSHYWKNPDHASVFFNLVSWNIFGVRGGNYSPYSNQLRINVKSTNKGGYNIQVTWNVALVRDKETLEWKIISVTE